MNAKREIHTPETDKFDDGGDTKAVIGDMVVIAIISMHLR